MNTAIEVAAQLDDTIVNVKHVANPRGGKLTRATYVLFGAGVGLLLMAAVGFAIGVSNASFNKRALHEWTEVQRRPLHDFRPRALGLGYDWMTFGGLACGIAALGFGLLRLRQEREQPVYRIGSDPGVEQPTADAPSPSFPLVAPLGDEFVLNFAAGMHGERIDSDGRITPLAELQGAGAAQPSALVPGAMQAPLHLGARYRVTAGRTSFTVTAVEPPRRDTTPLLASLDTGALGFFGASAIAHLGLLALLLNIPPDPKTLSLDSLNGDARFGRIEVPKSEDPVLQPVEAEPDDESNDARIGGGQRMALAEGKMGNKESKRESGLYKMKQNGDPQLARIRAMDTARRSGILGAFRASEGSMFASLTGTGDYSSGIDDRDVYGGLVGNEFGEMHSDVFGWGIRGTGPGGGGTGWGTVGTGRYGTIGRGPGTGGIDYGTPHGPRMKRDRRVPPPVFHDPTVNGDLDKAIIRRHIRKKLNEIKYCYEKQLLVSPDLEGTIQTAFTISGRGAVISVSASGMGDDKVEDCVAAAVKSIQFPAPTGGGLVNVKYPFTFRRSGN